MSIPPPSSSPTYRRRKRVQKDFEQLLLNEDHGTLFDGPSVKPDKARVALDLKRSKLIIDAISYGFWVPQSMRDEVNAPPDENPKVPDDPNDGKAPFWKDDDDFSDVIRV